VNHLTTGMWVEVHRMTAERVAAVYDELSMVRPVDSAVRGRGQIRIHDRQRRMAKRRGYAPPLAWDNIDDPNERPNMRPARYRSTRDVDHATVERVLAGDKLPTTIAEKREITRRWLARGGSLLSLEKATGWKSDRYTDGAA
jgi:hypothetical protein